MPSMLVVFELDRVRRGQPSVGEFLEALDARASR
jgi:hypothetical protein